MPTDIQKIFTDAQGLFPGNFTAQARHIVAAHRPVGLPKDFQPMAMGFEPYRRQRQQEEQQEEARRRAYQRQGNMAQQSGDEKWLQWKQEFENKRSQEEQRGLESCKKLKTDLQETQIPQWVEEIRERWVKNSYGVPIQLEPVSHPSVTLYPDGSIRYDLSKVGFRLSYTNFDVNYWQDWEYSPFSDAVEPVTKPEMAKVENSMFVGITFRNDYLGLGLGNNDVQRVKVYEVSCTKIRAEGVDRKYSEGGYYSARIEISSKDHENDDVLKESLYQADKVAFPDTMIAAANERLREKGFSVTRKGRGFLHKITGGLF